MDIQEVSSQLKIKYGKKKIQEEYLQKIQEEAKLTIQTKNQADNLIFLFSTSLEDQPKKDISLEILN